MTISSWGKALFAATAEPHGLRGRFFRFGRHRATGGALALRTALPRADRMQVALYRPATRKRGSLRERI
jgi:hypothetical protein